MPFARPTLPTLIARTAADAASRLTDGAPLLPVSNLAILARVLAGGVHGLYGYLDWIAAQVLPDTCEAEVLDRHAGVWGLTRVAATYGGGTLPVGGAVGAAVPAGTRWRRADGCDYLVTSEATIGAAGSAVVSVVAVAAGPAANCAAGTAVTLSAALVGISAGAVFAAGGAAGGADAEGDESLRARLLGRIRQAPHGGASFDYVAWALAAHPAVTRAWVYPLELGAGTVSVRVMSDTATADGIPEAPVVATVQAVIDAVRPVTAAVTVVAPIAAPLVLEVAAAPDTLAVRAAISAALADLIRTEAQPGGTLLVSHLREAISTAAGEIDHTLSAPGADVVAATGYITTFGGVTWL